MRYRNRWMVGILAAALAAFAGVPRSGRAATTVADAGGIEVKPSDIATPSRGMSMSEVTNKFGAPVTKVPAVGNPPISRWEYPGFVVYFERDHVIHSVIANS